MRRPRRPARSPQPALDGPFWNWAGQAVCFLRPRRPRASGKAERGAPSSSSGPGRRPFKAVARVRIPLGAPHHPSVGWGVARSCGAVGVLAALSRRRSRVQVPSGPPGISSARSITPTAATRHGAVARSSADPPRLSRRRTVRVLSASCRPRAQHPLHALTLRPRHRQRRRRVAQLVRCDPPGSRRSRPVEPRPTRPRPQHRPARRKQSSLYSAEPGPAV